MTAAHYEDGPVTVWHGDCVDVMRDLPDASIDAVVTDPPYGIDFMGKSWDDPGGMLGHMGGNREDAFFDRPGGHSHGYESHDGRQFQAWCELWAAEAFRLLKPGGHLLAFGGTRTFHRLAAGIEDAGFEIRDSIAWLYGSGFPKSLDVAKAIDKGEGVWRGRAGDVATGNGSMSGANYERTPKGEPVTRAARAWDGWGTALKPAFEPVVVGRKPLIGTVAVNVLAHGTGALNIDGCRTPMSAEDRDRFAASRAAWVRRDERAGEGRRVADVYGTYGPTPEATAAAGGRWPANVVLDASQAAALDAQSGEAGGGFGRRGSVANAGDEQGLFGIRATGETVGYGDTGGASRFFYTAKAATSERPSVDGIAHPTVKPVDLMRWLVRLVTPKGGTVLEPFAGSGSTVEAAVLEGFRCVAIEREADYLPLILQRIRKPHAVGLDFGDWDWEAGA